MAERDGFVAASVHLHLSQSAVSHAVKALEQALGAPRLLRGHRGGTTLTAVGAVTLAEARMALTAIERMAAGVAEVAGSHRLSGTLRIGVVQSAAVHLLPGWLRRLYADHPGIAVTLHEGTDRGARPHHHARVGAASGAERRGLSLVSLHPPRRRTLHLLTKLRQSQGPLALAFVSAAG